MKTIKIKIFTEARFALPQKPLQNLGFIISKNRKKSYSPRANGAKRRSGRKPGARVTNFALAEFKVVARGS